MFHCACAATMRIAVSNVVCGSSLRPVQYGNLEDLTPDVLLRHPRRCCSLDRRGSRGRLDEVMDVEDYRSQLILRKVKPSGLENGSRRSRLAHGCRKNQDEHLGGLISRERRGQRFANNYGVEERVAAARDCSSFESREALARRDPRGNSALWIGYP